MPVYALLLEYDGADYCGWQQQNNLPTIQATMEHALRTFLRDESLHVTGAGRTDAGVHARGQVAHFTCSEIPPDLWKRLVKALNGLLPSSIAVHAAVKTHEDFHARYDAKQRTYHYQISTARLALERSYRLFVISEPDFERMNDACTRLIGTHHFGSFCRTRSTTVNRICTVSYAQWEPEPIRGYWRFVIQANRFLNGMVRSLTGTLLEIGRSQKSIHDLEHILIAKDRRKAGPSLPAHALVLDHVTYNSVLFPP